jgi:hypothetical protein
VLYHLFEIAGFYRVEILTQGKAADRELSNAIARGITTQPYVKRSSERAWIFQRGGITPSFVSSSLVSLPHFQKHFSLAVFAHF